MEESTLNEELVELFKNAIRYEEKRVITKEFKDISNHDFYIIEAIGIGKSKNMSTVANILKVTVGTLTIAINNLVKKGYVNRIRSEQDRRVVLLSLSKKGKAAYEHQKKFHEKMIAVAIAGLDKEEIYVLVRSLRNLCSYYEKNQ